MNKKIVINSKFIGVDFPPYIVAEISANHNGSLNNAFRIIKEAKNAGASAVKLQTYKPDTITLNCATEEFRNVGGLWNGRTLYELYEEAHMPWDWHKPLFDYAKEIGITIFSSPFDRSAVDLLENLNAPAYKIASFEVVDLPLIKYVASTGKPLIISTGMANELEIQEAIEAAREGGCKEIAILHCVSGYPAYASEYNLRTILDMQKRFDVPVGLSDHTLDNITAITSVAFGACIIEKHFTLDRNGGGPDDSFSLEPLDLQLLCKGLKTAWESIGKIEYSLKSSEQVNIKYRRSLYFVKPIKSGGVITEDSIRSVRPGYGIAPKFFDSVIGKIVKTDVTYGCPVLLENIE